MSAASRDFLVEIGTEELPPKSLLALATAFADGIAKGLTEAGLSHKAVEKFATPRRLAVRVRKLVERQPDRAIERRGPPLKAAFDAQDFAAERFTEYGRTMREGIENMRKLVYAFYDQKFSFRDLTDLDPELAGDVTDCLSGDVNKDFTRLYAAVAKTTEVPEPLPYGLPLTREPALAPSV